MSFVPYVVEQSAHGERSYDIFSRLLNDRIIVLSEDVLLLPNQCRWGNQILWSIRIIRLFFGELFFLIRSPADVQPILIQLFFFFL